MVQCVNEACHRDIEKGWSFCPYCGEDNRPAESRPAVRYCQHLFVTGGDYCVNCGGKYGDRYTEVPLIQRKLGFASIGFGVFLIVVGIAITVIHSAGHGPGFDWISSWYDEGLYNLSFTGNILKNPQGPKIITDMYIAAAAFIIVGIAAANTKRSKFYG